MANEKLKNLKKKPLILEVEGSNNQKMRFFGLSNMKSFEECYTAWKTDTDNLRGDDIGSMGTKSLFQMIKSQGKTGRKAAGEDAGASESGAQGSDIIQLLDDVQGAEAITEKHKEALGKALDIMTEIKKDKMSKRNPRNIKFANDPIITNKRGIRIGEGKPVFGHFRTPAYEKASKKKNKHNGKTKIALRVKNSNWWSDKEGEATPPMYQALYGEESEIDIGIEMSLYYCVKTALETIENTPVGASRDTPIVIEKRDSWKIAKKVSGIRTIVNTWVAKPSAQGNMRKRSARAQILRTRIRLGDAGKSILKELMNIDLDNEVKSAYFKISEKQINRLAENIFNNKVENKRKKLRAIPVRQYNDLKIGNFEKPKEENPKEENSEKEKSKKDQTVEKKSWTDMLRRENYVGVL